VGVFSVDDFGSVEQEKVKINAKTRRREFFIELFIDLPLRGV